MGMWDEMCVVCGGPMTALLDSDYVPAENLEDLQWLNDRIGISEKEEVLTLGEESFYGSFDLDGQKDFSGATIFRVGQPWPEGDLYGLTCHRKCYELLERDLQYTLRFHDVWPMLMQQENGSTWLEGTDYGGMAKYIEQSFGYSAVYEDGNGWMLQDPTKNPANGERILTLWRSIIQSGFQIIKSEPECGEDGSSHAKHETALATHSVDESLSQNLHLQCNL